MKKFSLLLCCLAFVLSANTAPAYDYYLQYNPDYDYLTGESQGVQLSGKSYTKGNTDYIFVPEQTKEAASFTEEMLAALAVGVSDPFVIKIDGVQYVMLKENNDGVLDEKDILGFFDTPELLFSSLVALNTNSDYKITPDELKSQNVRLAAVGQDGKLLVNDKSKDFDLNKINYIDIKNLRKLANYTPDGVFGHFNMYLKDGRMIVGFVTFSDSNHLKNLF